MELLKLYNHQAFVDEVKPDFNKLYKRISKDYQNDELSYIFNECVSECSNTVNFKASFMLLPLQITCKNIDFNVFNVNSSALSKNLSGCDNCIIFGATSGVGLDRVIDRYSQISPLKAFICQSIGAEYIEEYCDLLCDYFKKTQNCYTRPRFSPGYSDLSLDVQKKLFDLLSLPKSCGLTLTESLIMRPSKSVTAFVGLSDKPCSAYNKCSQCDRSKCEFKNI